MDTSIRYKPLASLPLHARHTHHDQMVCKYFQWGFLYHCTFTVHRGQLYEALKQQLICNSEGKK